MLFLDPKSERTLFEITAAWDEAFPACFCSVQSMASPPAKIREWLGSCSVGWTLMYPERVRTSGPRDSTNLVFGRGPRVETLGFKIHEKCGYNEKEGTYDKVCRNHFLSASGDVTVCNLEVVNKVVKHQLHPTLEELGSNAFPPAHSVCIVQDGFLAMHDGDVLLLFDFNKQNRYIWK